MNNPNVKWDDIIGLDNAKRTIKEAVVYPIKVIDYLDVFFFRLFSIENLFNSTQLYSLVYYHLGKDCYSMGHLV